MDLMGQELVNYTSLLVRLLEQFPYALKKRIFKSVHTRTHTHTHIFYLVLKTYIHYFKLSIAEQINTVIFNESGSSVGKSYLLPSTIQISAAARLTQHHTLYVNSVPLFI